MGWYYRDFYPRFQRSRPRKARGGIKAQSKQGAFGKTWWAKRWIAVLESFKIGARLGRGRSYARQGQVLSIDVQEGNVRARVQGSRPKPYDVVIGVKVLTDSDWKKLTDALSGQAIYAAKLLGGEMPQDIEKAFEGIGLSLFPEKLGDLKTECSCPDYSNPCKHIAAVYYLLGEEFDRDPFLLFKLRGLSREELIRRLGPSPTPRRAARAEPVAHPPEEVLAADSAAFWHVGAIPEEPFGAAEPPPVDAALPRRLGPFPFWRGSERFLDSLEPIYRLASEKGREAYLGKSLGQ